MKELYLQCGRVALISDIDYDRCREHKWRSNVHNGSGKPYVCTTMRINGKRITIYLHRFIVDPPPTMKVDHRDKNTLHNWRSNLRIASFYDNNLNRAGWSLSGLKGVDRIGNRHRARISFNGETKHIGRFATAEEAAMAYDDEAHKLFGEFASLNYPDRYPLPVADLPELEIPFP